MMMKKQHGSFSKVGKLITVLQKCNGKTAFGEGNSLISPGVAKLLLCGFLLALTAGLAAGVYYIQPFVAGFISAKGAAQGLMLALLIMTFALAIKDIVTVLYTANDLELLIPLPYSASQIVMAKLAVVAVFPVCLCFVVLNGVCLGFGIREGAGVAFYIGSVLSNILIPVTGIFAATLLVVLIFRIFGFIRNRDITVALGGIFTFGLSIAYVYFSNQLHGEEAGKAAATAFNAFSSVSSVFPNIEFMKKFMFEGRAWALPVSVAATAVVVVLAMLAVKAFYFNSALSMKATGSRKKAVSEEILRSGKKNDVLRALTDYEAKSTRRNPAFLIYGYVMSFAWPVLFALTLIFGNDSVLKSMSLPLDTVSALLCFVTFAITASCFACGFNVLPGSAFTREGSNFSAIRALPVSLQDYYKSKRNYCMRICSLGSVLYVVVLGIVFIVTGSMPITGIWVIPVGAAVSFFLNLIIINLLLIKNSGKPRLNWDSETEFSRKLGVINVIFMVVGIISLGFFVMSVTVFPKLGIPGVTRIIIIACAAAVPVIIALACAVNHLACRKVPDNLMKIES